MVVYVDTPPNRKKGSSEVNRRVCSTGCGRRGDHKPLEMDSGSLLQISELRVLGVLCGSRGR